MLEEDIQKRIPYRVSKIGWVSYGIGDASGDGFAAAIRIKNNVQIRVASDGFERRSHRIIGSYRT